MSREETVKLFDDLKEDFRNFMNRIETKVDVATQDINEYAKDTIKHQVKIEAIEQDVQVLGKKVRKTNEGLDETNENVASLKNKMYWAFGIVSGALGLFTYMLNTYKAFK